MFKIVLLAALVALASAGQAPIGSYVNYGYNIAGLGHGGGHGHGGYGGYGGYGQASVKFEQSPHSYNYGVQTHGHGGNSYVHQAGHFGGYGGYAGGGYGHGHGY